MALLRLVHITLALAFITGLVGRAAAFRQARSAGSLEATAALMLLSDWFDRRLVIPGSLLVVLSGAAASWLGHWPLFTAGRPSWLLVSLLLLLLMVSFIPTALVPQRRRRHAALASALQMGRRTPELDEALRSVVVLRVRLLELVIVGVVLALMVLKPF